MWMRRRRSGCFEVLIDLRLVSHDWGQFASGYTSGGVMHVFARRRFRVQDARSDISHAVSQRYFSIYFFQIFTLRVKIWKNESFKYLAAAGESADSMTERTRCTYSLGFTTHGRKFIYLTAVVCVAQLFAVLGSASLAVTLTVLATSIAAIGVTVIVICAVALIASVPIVQMTVVVPAH
jgi:hypothetical protein